MEVKKYRILKMNSVKGINRIINEIKKIESVFNATIDKQTRILRVECTPTGNIIDYYSKLEKALLKAVKLYEKQAQIEAIDNTQVYRKVLYLNGLDCAYCGTRIENYAQKELNHERIVVDYPTQRFIIETTDKNLIEHLTERVTEIAHKVDDRIIVETYTKNNIQKEINEKSISKVQLIIILIGLAFFIVGFIMAYTVKEIIIDQSSPENLLGVIFIIVGYILIGHRIICRFFKNLFKGHLLDENFLMTIASFGALVTCHFSEAAIVMILYQLGEFLQQKAVNKSRKSISNLLNYDVQTVKVKLGDEVSEIAVEGVLPDDVIVVSKGEMIPLDGIVCKGKTYLDTKYITGESKARSVNVGDEIISGSINIGSIIEVRVLRSYSNSMISRILDLVENATISKSKSENFIAKFARYYTPIVVVIAFLIGLIGSLTTIILKSGEWTHWVYVAMEFLVISCPCALVISVPLCFFTAIGVASKRGILIKGSNYLEALYNVNNVVFDKTGTLTKGEFGIVETVAAEGVKKEDVERLLIYTEYYSTHPIGVSLVEKYGRDNIFTEIISEFQALPYGAKAVINGSHILIGNAALAAKEKLTFPVVESVNLVIYVFKEKTYLGHVLIGDVIRDEAPELITYLKKSGIQNTVMLTGDASTIAESVANTLQIDEVFSCLLPDQKVQIMDDLKARQYSHKGSTIYVGDGINDAPVIAASDVGIAMGDTASDATISIADVVIMNDNLHKISDLLYLAKKTHHKVIENIVFALTVKFLVMIMALALSSLPLWIAIFSDVGVSLLAIFNSLRLMQLFNDKENKNGK